MYDYPQGQGNPEGEDRPTEEELEAQERERLDDAMCQALAEGWEELP